MGAGDPLRARLRRGPRRRQNSAQPGLGVRSAARRGDPGQAVASRQRGFRMPACAGMTDVGGLAFGWRVAQHAAADLIALHGFEQRLEIAFAKTLVTFALDDLEKDRSNQRGGEYLQEKASALLRTIGENAQCLHAIQRLAMA